MDDLKDEGIGEPGGAQSSSQDGEGAEASGSDSAEGQGYGGAEEATNGGGNGGAEQEIPRPRQPTYVETLERRLQETQDQLREYIQAYKQVKEDKDDFKRRIEREKSKDLDTLRGRLVGDLLEVLDNLDRSVQGGEAGWNAEAMLSGLRMVRGQFLEKLQTLGLVMVDPIGQKFDPNEAEALDMVAAESADQDNKVTRVYTRGFKMNDRVIRPARVQVAHYSGESQS